QPLVLELVSLLSFDKMRHQLTLEQRIYVCKCCYKYESARRIDNPRSSTKLLKLKPYKCTRVHCLNQGDPIARVREDNISSIFYKVSSEAVKNEFDDIVIKEEITENLAYARVREDNISSIFYKEETALRAGRNSVSSEAVKNKFDDIVIKEEITENLFCSCLKYNFLRNQQ
ncbi:hypothetical protein L9F63_019696, partial [Diploptera punctata]